MNIRSGQKYGICAVLYRPPQRFAEEDSGSRSHPPYAKGYGGLKGKHQ
jgi:hypothetical protein